jgi:eukaryotic-like serine/threonine-protein kinase
MTWSRSVVDVDAQLASALADRYRIQRELGRGGMATVYLAHDLRHDRPVAVKVLHPELAATLGPERFLREIRTAARLQHPHILTVHDSGEAAGQLWYTMPFVDGETLRDRLRRERQLPLDDALQITREVADALGYAHSQGIVHRDVKPENILLSRGHALVADFGVARALQTAGSEQLTQTGTSVGTPAYMSPEQAMGDSAIDGRSDLYSLGCVLYEMLTGEAPYTGPSAQAITAKRLLDPIPSARRLRETVPLGVDSAVQRVLAKAPADRFSSAEEFVRALTASPEGIAPVLSFRARKSPAFYRYGSALILTLMVLATVVVVRLWKRHQRAAATGTQSTGTGPNRLAVLPFESLGDSGSTYFAEGIAGEIRGKLAGLPALEVIASSSSNQYRRTPKSPRQIGRELGVKYLLGGRVQWDKAKGGPDRVRVSPELVDAATGATKWERPFDATMTDVFQVQADIAERVAEALNVALREPQQRTLSARPTQSLAAYDYYLRGNDYFTRAEASGWSLTPKDFESAAQMYTRAVAADPRFALAHAKLARSHLELYRTFADQSPEELQRAKAAADDALRLAPDLPDAHLALGAYLALAHRDYLRALQEFAFARTRDPSNADLLSWTASVWTMKGRFDSSATYWRRAAELDPRSPRTAMEAAWTLLYVRAYPEAQRYLDRAKALAPDWIGPRITEGLLYMDWEGDSARAREILRTALLELGVAQAAQLPLLPLVHFTSDTALAPALDRLRMQDFGSDTTFYYLWKGYWHSLRGHSKLAWSYSNSARKRLELLVQADPSEYVWHHHLAVAYAGLGRKTDAIRQAQRAVRVADSVASGYGRADARFQLALIEVLFGELEDAVDQLSELMKIPSQYSENFLRVYPGFAALRGDLRFERLVNSTYQP